MTGGSVPAPAGIGRVALTVGDLDETLALCRDVVGLVVRWREGGAATLGTDEDALLELRADPDAPARPETVTERRHRSCPTA